MISDARRSLLGSGLAVPFGPVSDGYGRSAPGIALAADELDVEQALWILLSTAPGERVMRPEFGCGIHRFVFETTDAGTLGRMEREIREALHRWEPRVELERLAFELQHRAGGAQVLLITLTYKLRATMSIRNLVYPFYVVPTDGTGT
ncbi:MAG: GPW/gp25 family protein [Patulibacter minatonensis]